MSAKSEVDEHGSNNEGEMEEVRQGLPCRDRHCGEACLTAEAFEEAKNDDHRVPEHHEALELKLISNRRCNLDHLFVPCRIRLKFFRWPHVLVEVLVVHIARHSFWQLNRLILDNVHLLEKENPVEGDEDGEEDR